VKLLVVGATGKIGREVVVRALARKMDVTALVRTPEKLRVAHPRLNVVIGTPTAEAVLAPLLDSGTAVISTLGHTNLADSSIVADAALATLRAMAAQGAQRLLIISTTLVAPGGSFLTAIPRYITRHAIRDSADTESVVCQSPLTWTVLRLPRLTNSELSPYAVSDEEAPSISVSVARQTVAECLLDFIEDSNTFRRILSVRSAR
jgi:putative NADH-flavin reductase